MYPTRRNMKSSTKSSIRNILVSVLLLSSSAFFGWVFWSELNRTVENVGGVVVGEIVEIRGQAQRRYNQQSRWGSLNGSEEVYNLDAIRTSSNSGAVIVLKNIDESGNELLDEISLGPDTYIILDLSGKTRNINFVGGNISASGSNGLTVSAEGTLVTFNQGSVNLNRKEGEQTSVTVTEGEATVKTREGSTVVGTDAVLHINETSGVETREQVALTAKTPKSNDLLLTYNEQRQVDFSWELFADWQKPILEVSSNSSFNESEAQVFRMEAASQARLTLPPGLWYWRVVDTLRDESGPINVFSIDMERKANPISPAENLVIPFRGDAPAVSLQWNRAWFADSYTLEMSRTASFAETPVIREVSGSSILIENLSSGTWWWRITPEYRRGILENPPTVTPRSFVLEQRVGHERITLVNPADNATISALDVREGVPFRWENQEGLVSYRLKVASSRSMSDVLAETDGPENWKTLLPAPEPETYYWQVEGVAADGLPVPASDIRSFIVRPLSGSVELVDPSPGETREIEPYSSHTFLWRSEVPGTARFQLDRISDEDTGERTRIIESLVNGESFTAPLPGEGLYSWRIQILDKNSRTLVQSTEGAFTLRSEFSPPVLSSPKPGSSVSLIGSSALTISWNPAPGADAYRVVLKAPDGTVISRDDRTVGLIRDFTLGSSGGIGSYTVELSSIRDNPPAGASKVSSTASYRFNVSDFVQYSAAVLQSPANGTAIPALNALRNGITLNWNQDPPLGRYTVELSNDRVTRLYQTTEPTLTLDALEEGNYRWVVKSRDSFGQEAPDSGSARFTVSELPTPSRPVVTSPASGEDIDMTGRRNLVFTWQPVDGADFYDIALYVEGSGSPILRKTGITGTRYALNNLRILDVGNFILSIRARSEYEDVGVTRSSPRLRVPFSLSVNIADTAPTILTDELQYAE